MWSVQSFLHRGFGDQQPSQQHPGLLQVLRAQQDCLQHAHRHFLYTQYAFVLFEGYSYNSVMNSDLNRCLNNFFQKIIGDILIIRLFTGNNFTIILLSPYRFLLYHLPCSLYFSVGNWFCEGALHHSHWL